MLTAQNYLGNLIKIPISETFLWQFGFRRCAIGAQISVPLQSPRDSDEHPYSASMAVDCDYLSAGSRFIHLFHWPGKVSDTCRNYIGVWRMANKLKMNEWIHKSEKNKNVCILTSCSLFCSDHLSKALAPVVNDNTTLPVYLTLPFSLLPLPPH